MVKIIPLILLSTSIIFQTIAYAECKNIHPLRKNNQIDSKLEKCASDTGTTLGLSVCFQEAKAEWDKVLNKTYKELMKILPKSSANELRESQRLWIKMRTKDNSVMINSNCQGSWCDNQAGSIHLDSVRNRALILISLYQMGIGLGKNDKVEEFINNVLESN